MKIKPAKKISTLDLYEDGSLREEFIASVIADAGLELFKTDSVEGLNSFLREKGIFLAELKDYCQSYLAEFSQEAKKQNPYWCWDYIETVGIPTVRKYLGLAQSLEEVFIEAPCFDADYNCVGTKDAFIGFTLVNQSVLNLTQHAATAEQVEAGVVEPAEKSAVQAVLTFDAIPSIEEIQQRALLLAAIAAQSGCKKAMIGGAPFFMSALESALKAQGIAPVYAFSQRESVDSIQSDGSVVKTNVFKHVGFVEV